MEPNNNEFEKNQNNIEQEQNYNDYDNHVISARKILVPSIVAVLTMALVTVGATWAFYNIQINGSSSTTSVSTSVAEQPVVTISGGKATLSLNLSAANMSESTASTTGKVFWASTTGAPSDTKVDANVATVALTKGTKANCTFTLKITPNAPKTFYSAYQLLSTKKAGEMVLTVNGKEYDLNTSSGDVASIFGNGLTLTGQSISLTSQGETKNILANFKFTNSTSDQTGLAGTGFNLSISTEAWDCKPVA